MDRTNSFWKWFFVKVGEIVDVTRKTLHFFFKKIYLCWYDIFIVLGVVATFFCLLIDWVVYTTPAWRWTGDNYQLVRPLIEFWMISNPVISFIVFMVGLYGYWRKEIRFE